MPEDLARFCCQNQRCLDYGKRGIGNLTVCARYGKDKQRRMLYCRSCKARFSERKGTPLFGSQLTEEKALSVWEHLAERNGVRATARLVKVNRNTVVRYRILVGFDEDHGLWLATRTRRIPCRKFLALWICRLRAGAGEHQSQGRCGT